MIIIHFGTSNTGIHTIPVCVAWYDTNTKKGAYYVIKPSDYWEHDGVSTGCKPTYKDCIDYGLSTSYVSRKLNEQLKGLIIYSENPISVSDCIQRLYESCGDRPEYTIENLSDFIPNTNYGHYIKTCTILANSIKCNNAFGYVYTLSGIVKVLANIDIDNSQ
tara:strand:+ start:44 stop:529 length:486 start_codon:yes stop_codon:yes gene_type:complete